MELEVLEGPDSGLRIAVSDRVVLGRDQSADVPLSDLEISRRHARLTLDGADLVVEDLGSMNGSFVNEDRISGRRTLQPGDRVRLGTTVLEVRPAPEPARPEPTTTPERTKARPIPDVDHTRAGEVPDIDLTRAGEAVDVGVIRVPDAGVAESPSLAATASAPAGELRIIAGPLAGQTMPLRAKIRLGRDLGCDIVLSNEEISRRHAEITSETGHVRINDLGSTNGTYVNGERLIGTRGLQGGDRIELGSTTIVYVGSTLATTEARPSVAPQRVNLQPRAAPTSGGSRKWWTLVVVCVAVFMLLLDTNIVAVALPTIAVELHASFSELQWVVDAYSLGLAVLLLTAGSVSDVVGRRHVFTMGLVVFTLFSAVCGLAWSAAVLDISRGLQAVGGAMMFATSLALLAQEFPPGERGMAFGVWGATTATAVAIGPLIGGALTTGIGWQAIFYVNVPIGLVAIFFTVTRLKNMPGPPTKVDVPGGATFTAALFALVFALIRGNDEGWTSPLIIGLLMGTVVCLVAFAVIEAHTDSPMLPLSLFRIPTFLGTSLAGFAISGSAIALIIYITLWLQTILDYSPLQAGLRMLPLTLVALVVSPLAGKMSGRVPARLLMGVGLGIVGVGILLMSPVRPSSGWTALLPGFILTGAGIGLTQAPLASASVGVVAPSMAGTASGINSTFRQVGLATGIAALGAVFVHVITTHMQSALAHTPVADRATSFAKSIAAGGTQQLVAHAKQDGKLLQHAAAVSFTSGLADILVIGAILAFVGALGAAVLVRKRDEWRPTADGPQVPSDMPGGRTGPPGSPPGGPGGPPGATPRVIAPSRPRVADSAKPAGERSNESQEHGAPEPGAAVMSWGGSR